MPVISPLKQLPPESVLHEIVARKITEVEERVVPLADLEPVAEKSDRSFIAALETEGLALIAEIKRRSPSKGLIREDLDPLVIAATYARHASAISVLCDSYFFGGALGLMNEVRNAVEIPVLMKDFVISRYQLVEARAYGADGVLLMASILQPSALEPLIETARSLGMEPLVEVHDEEELRAVLDTSARIIGINNRDLRTLKIDLATFDRLMPSIDRSRHLVVAESGIEDKADVDRFRRTADAVLIGTTLMSAPDIEEKIRALGW